MNRFADPVGPKRQGRRRLLTLSFVLFFLFSLLIVRFYQIQILEGEKWTQIALQQHQSLRIEPFMRGAFFSNTSIKKGHLKEAQPFVIDVQKFHGYIDPSCLPDSLKEEAAHSLAHLLGLSAEGEELLQKECRKQSRSRKIASWLEMSQKERLEQFWNGFAKTHKLPRNGLYFVADYQRSYPFGSLLGAVLHTVQEEKDPKTQQGIPTGGLELFFAKQLEGKVGRRLVTHSPRHFLDSGTLLEAAQNGADIYLTINHYLQAVMESELEKGVRAVGAKSGWAVMMDPYTGEIWALAQTPSFHPAHYASYFNDPSLIGQTRVKAVSDCFEPGSIMKPITVAICLRANEELCKMGKKPLFSPEEKIASDNGWLPGRSRPLKDGRPHRFLNLSMAIQKSSNIYMARLVQRVVETMGEKWYRQALVDFGFGQKTGIELPAEQAGLLPTPGKLHPNGALEWSVPTPYSLAIGYNVLVTSLQVVRAYAMLINGGYAVEPHLVRKIVQRVGEEERLLLDRTTEVVLSADRKILSSSITAPVLKGLKFTTKLGGTSKLADIAGYTEAGKSGTAERAINGVYAKDHNIPSFIGFTPAKKPLFLLLVSIDDPEVKVIPGVGKQQMGGVSAAPVFREIASRTLQYLGVAPDDPYGYPPGDPRREPQKADWMAEVSQLQALYQEWNET